MLDIMMGGYNATGTTEPYYDYQLMLEKIPLNEIIRFLRKKKLDRK